MVFESVKDEGLRRARGLTWLAFPAALQIASALIVFLVGRLGLLPSVFDANGIGTSFASDATRYHSEAIVLVQTLTNDGIGAWFKADPQFHVKIYSLAYATFGRLVGFNIIAIEPLNFLYYLTSVYLIFVIGSRVFSRRAGLVSALIIACWPSFLLHYTQELRDPLVIALWLTLILIISGWLKTVLQWRQGLKSGLLAIAVSLPLWVIRIDLWTLIKASVVMVIVLLVVGQIRDRKFHFGNSLAATCFLTMVMITPPIAHLFPKSLGHPIPELNKPLSLPELIMARRRVFIVFEAEGATSSIDKDVLFNSTGDIVRYLPRAMEIGAFAPFPNMWMPRGIPTGSVRWLVAGAETLTMYVIELLACLTLWRRRRQLSVWLLCLIAAMGMLGLSLVVVNIGTLYRLRYPFLILLTIVASESLMNLKFLKTLRRRGFEAGASPARAT